MRKVMAAVALAAIAVGDPGSGAFAQAYPSQNIRMLVPYGGGGPSDIIARVLAESLSSSLGQTVVVENKTGAAGRIAMNDLLSKPKDGHTIHQCSYIDVGSPGTELEFAL